MNTELQTAIRNTGEVIINSPAVQGVVSSLITTLFVRRGEMTKAMEMLKAHEFEKVTNDLLNSGKLSYVELYKCRNFLKIAERADEVFANDQEKESEQVSGGDEKNKFSFDWLMRFFDAVGNISNEELQQLWGKVLANEISHPKSCSLRTLDMIRNMPPEEAETFSMLCRYVMQSGDSFYIDSAGFFSEEEGHQECRDYIKRLGLSYEEHIIPLIEAGVLSVNHDLAIYINRDMGLEVHNDKLCGFVMSPEEESILLQRDAYFLTVSGKELFHIIHEGVDYDADEEYALLCLKDIKRQHPEFDVSAFSLFEDSSHSDLLKETE